jgi:hypothetical protein
MILLLLGLLALGFIYITRLLHNHGLKVATYAVAALFGFIVVWIYCVFIFDAASLGFNGKESWRSILIGSDIYRSFVDLNASMAVLPTEILHAITYVSAFILLITVFVIIHGLYLATIEILHYAKSKDMTKSRGGKIKSQLPSLIYIRVSVYRLYCRMNC